MKDANLVHGIVVVDKSAGMTSHDVVGQIRKLFKTRRVGHTGTLDPDATGVLVLCLGNATRLVEYLAAARKNYVAEIVIGVETSTQDASGAVISERDASYVDEATLQEVLPRFRGAIEQIPPMVSALHHEGRRLYELAREGIEVERAPRSVTISNLVLTGFVPGVHPVATLDITCSTGTYIRALAADIGAAIGVGGMMRSLRRIWVGADERHAFLLDRAQTLDHLREREALGTLSDVLMPMSAAVSGWKQIVLNEANLALIRQGKRLPCAEIGEPGFSTAVEGKDDPSVAIVDLQGTLCAVARIREERLEPVKVFV